MTRFLLCLLLSVSSLLAAAQAHDRKNCRLNPKTAKPRNDGESGWTCPACVKEVKEKREAEKAKREEQNQQQRIASAKKAAEGKAEAERRMEPVNASRKQQEKMGTVTITNPASSGVGSTRSEWVTPVRPAKPTDTLSIGSIKGKNVILANRKDTVAFIDWSTPLMQSSALHELTKDPKTRHFFIPAFKAKKVYTKASFTTDKKYWMEFQLNDPSFDRRPGYERWYFINAKGEVMFPDFHIMNYQYLGEGYYLLVCDELKTQKMTVKVYDKTRNKLLSLPPAEWEYDIDLYNNDGFRWSGKPETTKSGWITDAVNYNGLPEKLKALNATIYFGLREFSAEARSSDEIKRLPFTFFAITPKGELKQLDKIAYGR